MELPVLDVGSLVRGEPVPASVADALGEACRRSGFFYAVGHGVDAALVERLLEASRRFFALPLERKQAIAMARGGRAWRGYFPVGGELTQGKADLKEGLYFGEELGPEDARVAASLPLHGPNLFPPDIPELRAPVLTYMEQLTRVGHGLVRGLGASLGLSESYFDERYTHRPLVLFRLFHYPPPVLGQEERWGVGAHCDYGLLTLLLQDDSGGLEVNSASSGWVEVPPVPGSFVCNIGDMLERLTGGLYRSTLHRVRNRSGRGRLSCPFFFDPGFDARIEPLRLPKSGDGRPAWDGVDLHAFGGTYGDYLLGKVSKVFPELGRRVL